MGTHACTHMQPAHTYLHMCTHVHMNMQTDRQTHLAPYRLFLPSDYFGKIDRLSRLSRTNLNISL